MSMPRVGIKTAATILLTIGDAGTFTSAGHLAAYAGIATNSSRTPCSDPPGSPAATIRPRRPTTKRNGNKERSTTPPSSVWPGAAATLSIQCSDTPLSTRRNPPWPLDEKHRDPTRWRHQPFPHPCIGRTGSPGDTPRSPGRAGCAHWGQVEPSAQLKAGRFLTNVATGLIRR